MKKSLFLVLLILSLVGQAEAGTYYIDGSASTCSQGSTNYIPTGVNARTCGAGGTATVYKTFNYADGARTWTSSDTIYVRAGTYTNDGWITPSGSGYTIAAFTGETVTMTGRSPDTGGMIVLSAYSTLDGIIFDGMTSTNQAVYINADHVTVKNCTFRNFTASDMTGIQGRNADYIHITNCTFTNLQYNDPMGAGEGIYFNACDKGLIENCTFTNIGHAAVDLQKGVGAHGSRYNTIRNNTVNQSNGGGGFYLNEQSTYNLIESNKIYNIGGNTQITQPKAGILVSSGHNTVRNNLVSGAGRAGWQKHCGIKVRCGATGWSNPYVEYNLIYNNTFYKIYGPPIQYLEWTGARASGYYVANNIFANNAMYLSPFEKTTDYDYVGSYTPSAWYVIHLGITSGQGAWSSFANGNIFRNNYMYTGNHGAGQNDNWVGYYYQSGGHNNSIMTEEQKYPAVFILGTQIWVSDPGFNDPQNGDFNLKETSPLIDAGVVIDDTNGRYVESNFPGYGWANLTYRGNGPDIGVDEVGTLVPATPKNVRISK